MRDCEVGFGDRSHSNKSRARGFAAALAVAIDEPSQFATDFVAHRVTQATALMGLGAHFFGHGQASSPKLASKSA